MGELKLPIYAYVDETGNTGHNLFDEVQPDFFTGALITKGDFDVAFGEQTRAIAATFGASSLHGKQLGIYRLESVSADLLRLFKIAKAHFFVSRVEKKYLLASKMFDSLFDSGENAAVGWHHYNLRALRLMLALQLAVMIDEETAKLFWKCILEPNEKRAYEWAAADLRGLAAKYRPGPRREIEANSCRGPGMGTDPSGIDPYPHG